MLSSKNFNYRFSGAEYAPVGKTRVWLFPGNRKCVELTIAYQDMDGDGYTWTICNSQKQIIAKSEEWVRVPGGSYQDDENEVFRQIDEAIAQIMKEERSSTNDYVHFD